MKGNNRREMAAFQVPFGGHLDFHFIEPLSHNGATVFHTLVIRFDFLFFSLSGAYAALLIKQAGLFIIIFVLIIVFFDVCLICVVVSSWIRC